MSAVVAVPLRRPGGWGASVSRYWQIGLTNARAQVAYAGESAVRSLFLVMILYVFLQLWRATYAGQESETLGGFGIAQMLWYLALTESIILSRPRISRVVDAEVRTGEIAYTLVRPYGYAGYRLASYVSERFVFFPVKLAVAVGLCLLYVGPVPFSPENVALGLAALVLATLLDFLVSFGIALLAFWTESTSSIGLIYDRLVMLLGGMLLPLEVFPEPLRSIAQALPFSSMVYAPARLALGGASEPAAVLFARQLAFILVAGIAVWALNRAAVRWINVNGG